MHIGELADQVELSHRTIRHYDDVGLLPASRTEGGFRVYSESDKQRMLTIRTLKPLGFSLEDMRRILDCFDAVRTGDDDAGMQYQQILAEITHRRDKMALNLRRADELLSKLTD